MWDPGKCLKDKSTIDHPTVNGQVVFYTLAETSTKQDYTYLGVTYHCSQIWTRPAGFIRIRYSVFMDTPSGNVLCAAVSQAYWVYNAAEDYNLSSGGSHGNNLTPCGSGWYYTLTRGQVYADDDLWHPGSALSSGEHYFPPS